MVLGIVAGGVDVIAGKGLDGVVGFPKRESDEVSDVAFDAAKDPGTFVAVSGAVVGNSGSVEEIEVAVGVGGLGWNPSLRSR